MKLKPDTFYFIIHKDANQRVQVCRTCFDWELDLELPEERLRGCWFYVLGHIDNNEYLDEYDLTLTQFVEIPMVEHPWLACSEQPAKS